MKHQVEISKQRVVNLQAGILTTSDCLTRLQNRIQDIKAENFDELKEGIIEELEETKDFLNWVKNQ